MSSLEDPSQNLFERSEQILAQSPSIEEVAELDKDLPTQLLFVNVASVAVLVYMIREDESNNFQKEFILIGKADEASWKVLTTYAELQEY